MVFICLVDESWCGMKVWTGRFEFTVLTWLREHVVIHKYMLNYFINIISMIAETKGMFSFHAIQEAPVKCR